MTLEQRVEALEKEIAAQKEAAYEPVASEWSLKLKENGELVGF